MKVTLLTYTPEARELLLFSKQTRLSMDSGLMDEIRAWPEEKKQAELTYMLGTIESSWEFVDYTFSLTGVSRAFTHQLVRTRDDPFAENMGLGPSYAQQSQRTVGMELFEFVMPEVFNTGKENDEEDCYDAARETVIWTCDKIRTGYQHLIQIGMAPQDARALLPTNVSTNIMFKANLATLSRMAEKRLCSRTQGEYQNVFREMRLAIIAVHPWAEPFLRVACAKRGVCQFPNYKECPIKPGIFNPETGRVYEDQKYIGAGRANHFTIDELNRRVTPGRIPWPDELYPLTKSEIQTRWESMKFEARPQEMKREVLPFRNMPLDGD